MRLEYMVFCEHARQEASGQFTLIGVISGNQLQLVLPTPEPQGPLSLPSFTVFSVFDYMEGATEIEAQCEMLRGSEIVLRTPPEKDRRSAKARFHNLAMTFAPLVIPGLGDYQFKIILKAGGRTLSFARKFTFARST